MGKKLIIILCISFLMIALGYKIKSTSSPELRSVDKSKVISLVNSYYNRMRNSDYQGALKLVALDKQNYDKDLQTLSNSNYNIKPYLDGKYWIVPVNASYDHISYYEQLECFGVEVVMSATYDNQTYLLNEIAYVKKFDNNFKIVKIDTTDRYSLLNISYISNVFSNKTQ